MFANMDYPWQDEAFSNIARLEVTQLLERLQGRPSVAVVCGSSEVAQQAAMLGLPPAHTATTDSYAPLAELVRNTMPDVVWLPTTPCGGTLPFHADSGVSHYFGVGAYRRPFEDARRAQVRFAAECLAFSNVPELPASQRPAVLDDAWKAGVPRDADADWDFEDVRDHYVEQLFDVDTAELRASDPDRYLALGRIATGEAMLRTLGEWRRPGSTCRGGLVWFAHDLAKGPGWGIIDASGRPKSVYWYLKRACAPVALLCADEGLNGLWVHALNDSTDAIAGELRVTMYAKGRMRGRPVSFPLDVALRSAESVHVDGLFDGFLDLTYAYRFGPPQHDAVSFALTDRTTGALRASACYFPGRLPHRPDPDLELSADVDLADDGYALVLGSNRFVHAVRIEIRGFLPDDNYLCLEPGQPRRVSLKRVADPRSARIPEGCVTALTSCAPLPVVAPEVVDAG
jgi:beta-mannosidase